MTFALERFDIVKQNYDKSGLYIYHDTVGKGNTDPNSKIAGNSLAEIAADNFFNPVAEELQVPGGIIIITATDGIGVYNVNQVYDGTKAPAVKLTALKAEAAADTKVGNLAELTTEAKTTAVAAINEVDALVATNTSAIAELEARKATYIAASTAQDVTTLVTNFNALLTALQTAGLMATQA